MNSTPPPVIDLHCHAAGIGAGGSGCFVSPALRRNVRYRIFLRAFGVSEEEILRHGDPLLLERLAACLAGSRSVSAAVVLAMDGVMDSRGRLVETATELYIPNDYLAAQCRRIPGLLFGASVNPRRADWEEQLRRAAADGAVLVKWLPSIQAIDPSDRALDRYYDLLRELRLPLLTHTGNEESFTRADNSLADPLRLRRPLEAGVTVIAAHCASNGSNDGQPNLARLLPMMDRYPNLYADISALTQANRLGHLQRVLRGTAHHERLLYGSDMPLIATWLTSPWFQLGRLPLREARRIAAVANPWDRDVALKRALGVTEEMLGNGARLLTECGKNVLPQGR